MIGIFAPWRFLYRLCSTYL